MTATRYQFEFVKFSCGCAYRTIGDVAVLCPQHHEETHRGVILGVQTYHTDTLETPDIAGLVMSRSWQGGAELLWNTGSNSLHTMKRLLDADGNEWNVPEHEQAGLCPACFIENDEYRETGIATCECGDERCSYRWCGDLTGIHAYWRLHVQRRSEEATSIPEEDIFSYGKFSDRTDEAIAALNVERDILAGEINQRMSQFYAAQDGCPAPDGDAPMTADSVYRIPWLTNDYQVMQDPGLSETRRQFARDALVEKIARLHVAGALPALEPAGTEQ